MQGSKGIGEDPTSASISNDDVLGYGEQWLTTSMAFHPAWLTEGNGLMICIKK